MVRRRLLPIAFSSLGDGSEKAGRGVIKLVVADRNRLDGGGIAALLERDGEFAVAAVAISAEETVEECRRHRPEVLVLTLSTPSRTGSPLLPTLLEALPGLRVVAVSERGFQDCVVLNPGLLNPGDPVPACESGTDCLRMAAAQGAIGTVRRDGDPQVLIETVRAAARGLVRHEPGTLEALEIELHASPARHGLSPRELQVAGLLALGLSNKEIATRLTIGEPTVKKHVGRVLAKLNLQDRLQAGLFVARHPLLFQPASTTD